MAGTTYARISSPGDHSRYSTEPPERPRDDDSEKVIALSPSVTTAARRSTRCVSDDANQVMEVITWTKAEGFVEWIIGKRQHELPLRAFTFYHAIKPRPIRGR